VVEVRGGPRAEMRGWRRSDPMCERRVDSLFRGNRHGDRPGCTSDCKSRRVHLTRWPRREPRGDKRKLRGRHAAAGLQAPAFAPWCSARAAAPPRKQKESPKHKSLNSRQLPTAVVKSACYTRKRGISIAFIDSIFNIPLPLFTRVPAARTIPAQKISGKNSPAFMPRVCPMHPVVTLFWVRCDSAFLCSAFDHFLIPVSHSHTHAPWLLTTLRPLARRFPFDCGSEDALLSRLLDSCHSILSC
jgi:hypothetical protein